MFNFGYLPGSDQQQTTSADSSLLAVTQAAELLAAGGIMTLLCYRGHPGGHEEATAIESWSQSLCTRFQCQRYDANTPTDTTPFLIVVHKQ